MELPTNLQLVQADNIFRLSWKETHLTGGGGPTIPPTKCNEASLVSCFSVEGLCMMLRLVRQVVQLANLTQMQSLEHP